MTQLKASLYGFIKKGIYITQNSLTVEWVISPLRVGHIAMTIIFQMEWKRNLFSSSAYFQGIFPTP